MVLGGSLNHILDRTAPLYFKVNAAGEVLYISKLFLKAIGKDFTGQQVEDLFILSKPFAEVISKLHNEKSSLDELVFLNSSDGKQKYKAGIHLVENDFFFTCNPIINSNFLIKDYNLTINDFPIHDTMCEFVFAQSANQAALRDVTNLFEKLAHRKEELINKNKELTFLLGEVHHRVKNNLAFISSLIEIEIEHSALTEVKGTLGGTIAY
jgi:hypothetical protein